MPLVRTDRPALLVGAVVMALFTLEVVRTGLVMTARTSGSLDAWVLMALATGALYALLFLVGHDRIRARGMRSRGVYAAVGAAAAVPPFLVAVGWTALAGAGRSGMLSALLVCPLVLGALLGFLYHRRAGYEVEGDDPAALAAMAAGGGGDGALLAAAEATYFDGPLVVRNSLGANALASLLGGVTFVLAVTFGQANDLAASPVGQFMAANGPGKTLLQGAIGLALPIGLLLRLTQAWLRARGLSSMRDYALAGIVGPLVFSILIALTGMSWFALAYLVQLLAPSLVAMLAYRSLAGLEPAPLPDDIEVTDRRTLVGADHVRRRMARIIVD